MTTRVALDPRIECSCGYVGPSTGHEPWEHDPSAEYRWRVVASASGAAPVGVDGWRVWKENHSHRFDEGDGAREPRCERCGVGLAAYEGSGEPARCPGRRPLNSPDEEAAAPPPRRREEGGPSCCDRPRPAILERTGRLFCQSCRRYLDVAPSSGGRPEGPPTSGPPTSR